MVGKKSIENESALIKQNVDARVLDSMARYDQIPLIGDSLDDVIKAFADYKDTDGVSYLEHLIDIFLNGVSDKNGKYAEYRFANFITSKFPFRTLPKIDFRYKIAGRNNTTHEFDIVGFNSYGRVLFVAEVKDRKSKINKTDISKFHIELSDIYQAKVKISNAFYGSSSLFTDDAKNMIRSTLDRRGYTTMPNYGIVKAEYYEFRVHDYFAVDL